MLVNDRNSYEVDTFIGAEPYTVTIDETPELNELISEAEKCQELPFEEKLQAVQDIAMKGMENAYEVTKSGMRRDQTTVDFPFFIKCTNIVQEKHSLGFALQAKAGCCRYQAILFFLLGAAAKLGEKHYLQGTKVNDNGLNTCYNDVVYEGKCHHVSIFVLSLRNKRHDYSAHLGSQVFENPFTSYPDQPFLAYSVDKEGTLHKYVRDGCHFDT